MLKNDADIIIALGGGSSIDAAKAVILMAKSSGRKDNVKFIAIPTTSGTGSEVTSFSVITDTQQGVKYPLVSPDLLPDIAILDPEFVKTVSPSITADTGFDVITHAIEACISTKATEFSDALAQKALELAFEYLPCAVKNGDNLEARDKMHKASCLAGMAFDSVSLGINHGIAHALGAKFHIPHGRANAMLLPHVIKFNAGISDNFETVSKRFQYSQTAVKLAKISKLLGISSSQNVRISVKSLIDRIKFMEKEAGIPAYLKDANVSKEDYLAQKDAIIHSALKDACTATNPRKAEYSDVEGILSNIAVW